MERRSIPDQRGIVAQNQGTSVPQVDREQLDFGLDRVRETINAGSHGISAGYLTGHDLAGNRYPTRANTSVYGDVSVDNIANITAGTGVGITAFNYGVGNVSVLDRRDHYGDGRGHDRRAPPQPNTASPPSTMALADDRDHSTAGSSINSGGTGLNVGNQATSIAAGAASTVTVVALGSIHSGSNNNNSGSAPAGILAGYNPNGANVFNANVFGDVFIYDSGNIIAAAGDGIKAYNYGIGDISVNARIRCYHPGADFRELACQGMEMLRLASQPSTMVTAIFT